MSGSDAWVPAPREGQRRSTARPDHLIVDKIRRHADQVQVAPTLADQFVTGCEGDQMRETLEGDCIAIVHVGRDRVLERDNWHDYSTTVCDCSRRYCGR